MALRLGSADGGPIGLTDQERARHVHVLGAVGSGKSKLLESCIRQDIRRGRGLCLIDPHGELSDEIERWCASRGLGRVRQIHLIKPGDDTWTPGFNPLRVAPGEAAAMRVDAMVSACAQVWGGANMNETPRLKKVLRAVFYALAAENLTIADALLLLRANDPEGTRRALTARLPDSVFRFVWEELNGLRPREFAEFTESTISRLTEFLAAPAVRLMIGQTTSTLDLGQAMDRDEIVIVNLGMRGGFSPENARVVGTLIIHDLFLAALRRDQAMARRHPFSLYVDEAYDFLTSDVERILDQCRKFGLHAVLSHQRLGQLRARGEAIYSAVMSSTRTKIIFGGLSDEDAAVMAREAMRDHIDLEAPKHILDKPVVVDEVPYRFESYSRTETQSRSRGRTETSGETASQAHSSAEGVGYRAGEGEETEQVSAFESAGGSESVGTSRSSAASDVETDGVGETSGWTEGRINVRKVLPTAVHSLEEQFHLAQLALRSLPDQTAYVKRMQGPAVRVRIDDVPSAISGGGMMSRFREAAYTRSPCVTRLTDAEAEIAARQAAITPDASQSEPNPDFWAE